MNELREFGKLGCTMRVLHYVDENRLAWMVPWIQLLKELEKHNVENWVLCRKGGTLQGALDKARIKNLQYNPFAQWLPAADFGAARAIEHVNPDLIHTRLSAAAAIGGYWGRKMGIPVLSTFDKYPKAHYYKNSDVLIGCSSAVTQHIKSLNLPYAKITTTILNPVMAERYTRDEKVRNDFRLKMGVGRDEIVVLGMGRLVDWKAWDDYLRAAASVPADLNIKFWLVGSGQEEKTLHKLSEELKVEHRVQFYPFAADVRPWLWSADIFVQTSRKPEGFSLMLIEAMASGLFPIATNIGGTLDIISDGIHGLLVSPGDVQAISAAIMKASNGEFRIPAAANAQKSAAEINVEKIAAQTLEVYKKTLTVFGRKSE